eukprot:CAMPEP_0196255038 /NCGR_PEP_ID=MMETSP0913-20130531/55117_1 /TAXON_ID=49265 /ORGANISM="Thalassiosira rotula, Strain GSO102" /LENGTH=429 /DNA_ID=CAMNT_0041542487 /DNA_START=28 /DNA_END=1317 /DNA_ORIENTATION=-
MSACDIQHYDISTASNMNFDEVFSADDVEYKSRFDSASHDEQQADIPAMAPISPCYSKASSTSSAANSITGIFSSIEYNYHIDRRVLGSGHHGSVRECINRVTGQRCAVKSIRKSDPAVKPVSLTREIAFLKEMKHRSIVHLADVYEDAEYVHLVTDLCEGGELFDRIIEKCDDDNGTPCFSEDEAAKTIYQILTAVSYMHTRGIVHRDLKPENVLYETTSEDSPIKIIDFGLSREHREGIEPPMSTVVGTPYYIAPKVIDFGLSCEHRGGFEPPMSTVVGTPYYIAPEVLKGIYDKSCDLWSMGVISYILLCGYPPFNGANNDGVHAAVQRGRYRFPSAEWSGTSREAKDFIRRLLQKDPRKRMNVEQALNHPWIVQWIANHDDVDADARTNNEAKAVFKGGQILKTIGNIFHPQSNVQRRTMLRRKR